MFGEILTIESIGDLNQNSCTISHEFVCANGTAVIEIFKDFEALLNNSVTFLSLDMCDKANTTSVMLVCWVIEPLGFREAYGRPRGGLSGS